MKLTKNLELIDIEEQGVDFDDTIDSVECRFRFFNETGSAFISTKNLYNDFPSYNLTEITSELNESFNELLEDLDNWDVIVEKVKEFIENY